MTRGHFGIECLVDAIDLKQAARALQRSQPVAHQVFHDLGEARLLVVLIADQGADAVAAEQRVRLQAMQAIDELIAVIAQPSHADLMLEPAICNIGSKRLSPIEVQLADAIIWHIDRIKRTLERQRHAAASPYLRSPALVSLAL